MKQSIEKKSLALYIHIPFCVKKCEYCDFLSFPAGEAIQRTYMDALLEEMEQYKEWKKWEIETIFIGGGTPSCINPGYIATLFKKLRSMARIKEGAEITIETNPGTLSKEKLEIYREAGINRLSMGLQSAQNEELKLLGRIHTYETFLEGYHLARTAGFQNINIDLMSALPGQSVQTWTDTLNRILQLEPEHISAYSLIIEEETPFYQKYSDEAARRERGEICHYLPNEEEERQMYHNCQKILQKYGLYQYEISNFSKTGYECRHNCIYWERKEYLGLGLGASSFINEVRFRNTGNMEKYLERRFEKADVEELNRNQQMEETMFLGLRLTKGVSLEAFEQRFSVDFEKIYGIPAEKLKKEGLLEEKIKHLRLTQKGMDLSNYAMSRFLLA